jgi:Ca2+-binding EF-hand superfamily protein
MENSMNASKLFKLALGSALWVSVSAMAATLAEADVNGDGKLSLDETQKAGLTDMANNFKALDLDKDGFLSKAELKANR